MMKRFFLWIFALALFAGCVSETMLEETGPKSFDSFTAAIEPPFGTKVQLGDNGRVEWVEGDQIGIWSDLEGPVSYRMGSDGVFRGSMITGNQFYAVYPYYYSSSIIEGEISKCVVRSSNCTFGVPDGKIVVPLVAKSDGATLSFKIACSLLHISIKGVDNKTLSRITFIGNGGEKLFGEAEVDMSGDLPVMSFESASSKKSVTTQTVLHGGESVDLYFMMPPVTLENGFTLNLELTDSGSGAKTVVVKEVERKIELERAKIKCFVLLDMQAELEEAEREMSSERDALVAIYNALGGDNWDNNTNWCSDKPVGEWYGVTTDDNGRVVSLVLQTNHLTGSIPKEIGNLSYLQILNLSSGDENGCVYKSDLENLNRISGTIPEELWNLHHLRRLYLAGLSLSGSIPEAIGNLKHLEDLSISGPWNYVPDGEAGQISGSLPSALGDLEGLKSLYVCHQKLSGEFPDISKLKALDALYINDNSFTGTLPLPSNPSQMLYYYAENNDFTGPVPSSISLMMEQPKAYIRLANNRLSGKMQDEISSHPNYWIFADALLAKQQDGYMMEIDETSVPACRYSFETMDGGELNLGDQYAKAEYTMIVRWREWCGISKGFLPTAMYLASAFKEKGLQTIWVYGGGNKDDMEAYMESSGLDQYGPHIIETWNDIIPEEAIWKGGGSNYGTPLVEIADKQGNIVFIDDASDTAPYSFVHVRSDLESVLLDLFKVDTYESTDYSKDGSVHLIQKATKGKGIDIVLMGDCFSDRMIADGTYQEWMNKAVEAVFSEEPYKTYRDRFNVYSVDVVSPYEYYVGTSALETWFGLGTHVGGNDDKVWEYVRKAIPEGDLYDVLAIVLMNRDYYAGTCHMSLHYDGDYGRGPAIAYCVDIRDDVTFRQIVSHEVGHGFAKLDDEYEYDYMGGITPDLVAYYERFMNYGWSKNVSFTSDPNAVKWAHFIADERYASESVGCYEGGATYQYGVWRPTENSIMRHNSGGFNAPSREAIYYRIHKLAYGADWEYNYEDFVAYDAVNRQPATAAARHRSYVERQLPPLAPPVIVEGPWCDAVK